MTEFDYTTFQSIRLRSEQDIMAGWKGDRARPLVSVVCTSFNHEAYIDDAIKGFLIQRTTFPFEIVIHDDASTDRTADKIRVFERQYPNIIRCVYQKENQYSKGRRPLLHTFHISSGKYIAICEGDDFWASEMKLQLQCEAMIAHPDINICLHSAYAEEANETERAYTTFGFASDHPAVLPAAQVIRGRGGFCATASIMITSAFAKNLPSWLEKAPVLDLFIQGLAAHPCGALYVPDILCVYRLRTANSWTSRLAATYISPAWLASYEVALNNFNRDTGGQYPDDMALQAAVIYYKGAKSSMTFGKKGDFGERIVKSFRYHPHLNPAQSFLYKVRWSFNWSFKALSFLYRGYRRWRGLANRSQLSG
jgi:glycosyltransferase involved in cell wall biosynthesis